MYIRAIVSFFLLVGGRLLLKKIRSKTILKLEYMVDVPIYKKQHVFMTLFSLPMIVDYRFAMLVVLGYILPIINAKQIEKKLKRRIRYEFSIWLRNLSVYLKYNTVYHALLKTYHLSPRLFRQDVDRLMTGIENNPQNRTHYLDFMGKYEHYDIQYMMKQLYRYASESNHDAHDQLIRMVNNANSFIRKSRTQSYKSHIDSRHWLGFIPLLLVSFVFMALMFVLIGQVLGGGWIA